MGEFKKYAVIAMVAAITIAVVFRTRLREYIVGA